MDAADKLIRASYALAIEQDWNHFRALALEQAVRQLGAVAGAWLTQPENPPGEFTAWPGQTAAAASDLLALPFKDEPELVLAAGHFPPMLPSARQAVAVRYKHEGSDLSSRVLLGFGTGTVPAAGVVARVTAHLAEAYSLALHHYILSDERLSRWGRSNRGTAAMVDARGVIYAASPSFRALLHAEFGDAGLSRMPFSLPAETDGEQGSFGHGTLRFRAVRSHGAHYLIYARKAQPLDGLSPREQEIARALSTGKTFKSVARQCGIATSTVANHASRIYRKLGIYRREELFEMLRSNGGARKEPAEGSPAV